MMKTNLKPQNWATVGLGFLFVIVLWILYSRQSTHLGAVAVQGGVSALHGEAQQQAEVEEGEKRLLADARRVQKAMKLMDDQIVALSDRVRVEEDTTPAPRPVVRLRQSFPTTDDDGESIFLSIASFRDKECGSTLIDLFGRAEKPENVHVGIVEQHNPEDGRCVASQFVTTCQHDPFCPTDNIRVRKLAPKDAKGPSLARYLSVLLYRGERYIFVLDSHNRFVNSWDTKLIAMYRSLKDPKAVLTHHPEQWRGDESVKTRVTTKQCLYLCNASFHPTHHYLQFSSATVPAPEKPMVQPYAATNFLFADGKLFHEVPFDPHLPFLFEGEEVLYAARMWTHGWNLYSPNQNILFHFYDREAEPKVWSEATSSWEVARKKSIQRVQYFLQSTDLKGETIVDDNVSDREITQDEEKYGLGADRTLEAYYRLAGIDPVKRRFVKDWCATVAGDGGHPSS